MQVRLNEIYREQHRKYYNVQNSELHKTFFITLHILLTINKFRIKI